MGQGISLKSEWPMFRVLGIYNFAVHMKMWVVNFPNLLFSMEQKGIFWDRTVRIFEN